MEKPWGILWSAQTFNGGIGKMYSNITGLSLGVSATIGLATFCSQATGEFWSHKMLIEPPALKTSAWKKGILCWWYDLYIHNLINLNTYTCTIYICRITWSYLILWYQYRNTHTLHIHVTLVCDLWGGVWCKSKRQTEPRLRAPSVAAAVPLHLSPNQRCPMPTEVSSTPFNHPLENRMFHDKPCWY